MCRYKCSNSINVQTDAFDISSLLYDYSLSAVHFIYFVVELLKADHCSQDAYFWFIGFSSVTLFFFYLKTILIDNIILLRFLCYN